MKATMIGITLTLSSALVYAVQTAIVKGLGGEIPIPVIVLIQSMVCLVLILPVIFAQGRVRATQLMKTKNIKTHIVRTLFSLGISYFLFSAVKFIPLVDAALLTNTAPLIMPILGFLFLSKKINHRLWIPLLMGFIGVALVLRPNGEVFQMAALLGLGAAICMAASIMLIRQTSKTDGALTSAFYYFLFSVPTSAMIATPFWHSISLDQLLVLLGIGALFFIVQITLIYSTKFVSAQTVSSLYLFNIIFSALIGWIIWHSALNLMMMSGMMITMIGAVLTIQAQGLSKPHQPMTASAHE